jgi:hypothetical protein
VAIQKPRVSDTVATGVLTESEYEGLSPAERAEIDEMCRDWATRFPPEWFAKERARIRFQLESLLGFALSAE